MRKEGAGCGGKMRGEHRRIKTYFTIHNFGYTNSMKVKGHQIEDSQERVKAEKYLNFERYTTSINSLKKD